MKKPNSIASAIAAAFALIAPATFAGMTQVDSFPCGEAQVEVSTRFSDRECIEREAQTISFKTGRGLVRLDSQGNPLPNGQGAVLSRIGDGWATTYLCVSGQKGGPKVIFTFGNGGNCEECEWASIFDIQGTKVAGGATPLDQKAFERAYRNLGLKGSWSSQGFVGIGNKKCQ